jgi:predicted Zn-dependent protease
MHLIRVVAGLVALAAVAASAGAISYEGERELCQQFDLAVRQRAAMIDDPDVVAYVNGVGKRVTATLDDSYFEYQFAVIRDPRINAFAVPGGYVYVHSGLLAALHNDDELAAVLGHEIGHVHAHHINAPARRRRCSIHRAARLPAVGGAAGGGVPATTAASQAVALQYSREFEQEADYLGARSMQAAGYDPRAMLDFSAQASAAPPGSAPPYLQTQVSDSASPSKRC